MDRQTAHLGLKGLPRGSSRQDSINLLQGDLESFNGTSTVMRAGGGDRRRGEGEAGVGAYSCCLCLSGGKGLGEGERGGGCSHVLHAVADSQ